jgi:hypothetical protein
MSSLIIESKHLEEVVESSLGASKHLLNVLANFSLGLTNFTRSVCVNFNLDTNIRVIPTLMLRYEHEVEGGLGGFGSEVRTVVLERIEKKRTIPAWYDPESKTIFIYFELDPDKFCLALAHELVHHCQYTCHSETCRSVCEYWLNLDKGHEIRETIPYNLRPHEIEAYSKDEELCKRIRELKEFNEIVKNISDAIRNIKEIIALMMMIHSRTQS